MDIVFSHDPGEAVDTTGQPYDDTVVCQGAESLPDAVRRAQCGEVLGEENLAPTTL